MFGIYTYPFFVDLYSHVGIRNLHNFYVSFRKLNLYLCKKKKKKSLQTMKSTLFIRSRENSTGGNALWSCFLQVGLNYCMQIAAMRQPKFYLKWHLRHCCGDANCGAMVCTAVVCFIYLSPKKSPKRSLHAWREKK